MISTVLVHNSFWTATSVEEPQEGSDYSSRTTRSSRLRIRLRLLRVGWGRPTLREVCAPFRSGRPRRHANELELLLAHVLQLLEHQKKHDVVRAGRVRLQQVAALPLPPPHQRLELRRVVAHFAEYVASRADIG